MNYGFAVVMANVGQKAPNSIGTQQHTGNDALDDARGENGTIVVLNVITALCNRSIGRMEDMAVFAKQPILAIGTNPMTQ